MAKNAVCVWDFTWFNLRDEEKAKAILREHCKKWTFQEECCPTTGNLHFQGRISLKVKTRNPFWENCDIKFSITHCKDDDFYVTKTDTRVRGPWKDDDEEIYIPIDVRMIKTLHPWQTRMTEIAKTYEPRKINIIVDMKGNTGKSTFVRIMRVYKIARKIPFANDYRDIMRMVMDMPEAKCYIFDLPRAISKEKLYQFFSAIEEIKGGYAFDDRYHFKERIFDPPVIIVFTNSVPDRNLLSQDRWQIQTINNRLELEAIPTESVIISNSNQPAQPAQYQQKAI